LFAGENKYGTAVRTTLASGLENIGARAGEGQVGAAGRWVAANRGWLRVGAVLVGVVVLLWGNQVSMERLWWSLATVVVGLAAIQILIGAGQDTREAGPLPQGDIDVEAT
jgi:hypothetical protein